MNYLIAKPAIKPIITLEMLNNFIHKHNGKQRYNELFERTILEIKTKTTITKSWETKPSPVMMMLWKE